MRGLGEIAGVLQLAVGQDHGQLDAEEVQLLGIFIAGDALGEVELPVAGGAVGPAFAGGAQDRPNSGAALSIASWAESSREATLASAASATATSVCGKGASPAAATGRAAPARWRPPPRAAAARTGGAGDPQTAVNPAVIANQRITSPNSPATKITRDTIFRRLPRAVRFHI